jgi:predicted DNA-binding transcriptional regulator YafY
MEMSPSRAERQRQIERLLRDTPGGLRAGEVAAELGLPQRTVYRDLEQLKEMGVPVWHQEGRFGISSDPSISGISLSFDEAMTLYIATRLLARYADEYNPHIVNALEKLAGALPAPIARHILQTAVLLRRRPTDDRAVSVLEQITRAWAEQRLVRLWYRSPRSGELRQRELAPYFLEISGPAYSCYVIGFDTWAKEMRTYKLDRLERAQMLDQGYEIPPDFDANTYLADSWGIMRETGLIEVVLQFSARVAALLRERTWHPSQTIDELANGDLLFTIRVSDAREMRPWIRSWGDSVEVLEPAYLRDEMVEQVRQMAELYQVRVSS